MKPIKMRKPVTALRYLDYEIAIYLALHPREKARLRQRENRRKFALALIFVAVLVAAAKWSLSR